MDAADTAIFISCTIIALALWLQEIERKSEAEERQLAVAPQPANARS
jgi:hypothetical protein